jgi:excisionase family DNA binding protein
VSDRLASLLVGELLALSDDDLRPLAERLAPFLAGTPSSDAFLSVDQAAARLGVHPNTVYRMIVGGRLRAVRAGRLWRIPETELARVSSGPATVAQRRSLTPPRASRRFGDLVRDLPYAGPG